MELGGDSLQIRHPCSFSPTPSGYRWLAGWLAGYLRDKHRLTQFSLRKMHNLFARCCCCCCCVIPYKTHIHDVRNTHAMPICTTHTHTNKRAHIHTARTAHTHTPESTARNGPAAVRKTIHIIICEETFFLFLFLFPHHWCRCGAPPRSNSLLVSLCSNAMHSHINRRAAPGLLPLPLW